MFDSHIHTRFSTDCDMNITDAITKSKKLGVGLIITDHMDLNYPRPGEFLFDTSEYFEKYSALRGEQLLLGIEIGMQGICCEDNRDIALRHPFDFVLGSLHLIDGEDIFMPETYGGKIKSEIYEKYFRCMLECVKSYNFIDSLGHIDYIARYATYGDSEIYYEEYSTLIDEVLKIIAQREISMEVNTRRFNNRNIIPNLIKLYKRFRELGGKTVTIGSDSHHTGAIGSNFEAAWEIAETCGLKAVFYKERKPFYDKKI